MSVGGLKISGANRGEWIVSSSDVWLEPIAVPPRAFGFPVSGDVETRYRPYYLRRLNLFGREINVWVPDFAARSEEAMNDWAIENLLNANTSNALRTYGVVPLRSDVA